jgi:hypothetical protein
MPYEKQPDDKIPDKETPDLFQDPRVALFGSVCQTSPDKKTYEEVAIKYLYYCESHYSLKPRQSIDIWVHTPLGVGVQG